MSYWCDRCGGGRRGDLERGPRGILFVPVRLPSGWRLVPYACTSMAMPWTREDQQHNPHQRVVCRGESLTTPTTYGSKDHPQVMPPLRPIDHFQGSGDGRTGINVRRDLVATLTHEGLAWLWTMIQYADRYHGVHGELPREWHQFIEGGGTLPWPMVDRANLDESFDRVVAFWARKYAAVEGPPAAVAGFETVGAVMAGAPAKPAESRAAEGGTG